MRVLRPEYGHIARPYPEHGRGTGVGVFGQILRLIVGLRDAEPGRGGHFHQFVARHDHLHVDVLAVCLEKSLRPGLCLVSHLHGVGAAGKLVTVRGPAGQGGDARMHCRTGRQRLPGIGERGIEFREARAPGAHRGERSKESHAGN